MLSENKGSLKKNLGFQSHKNLNKEGRDFFLEPRKVGIEIFLLLEPNSRSHKILKLGCNLYATLLNIFWGVMFYYVIIFCEYFCWIIRPNIHSYF